MRHIPLNPGVPGSNLALLLTPRLDTSGAASVVNENFLSGFVEVLLAHSAVRDWHIK